MRSRVTGIVLAAGASSRMGRPKALIEHDGVPWVRLLADKLVQTGCRVLVVWGAHRAVAEAVPGLAVEAPDWRAGMRASLRAAARRAPGPYLVCPVDCPFVSLATLRALVAANGTVVPTYRGSPGHPLRIAAAHGARLLAADDTRLDRLFLPRSLPVSDPAIRANLNRPSDLEKNKPTLRSEPPAVP